MSGLNQKEIIPSPAQALPGRSERMPVPEKHFVLGTPMQPQSMESFDTALFGLGCFWGVERCYWNLPGVYTTSVGYAGGHTPNPSYQEVCSGMTGHNEVVKVIYDPKVISYRELLQAFWEAHNPTQGMRQGNDRGTQYRSGIYAADDEQMALARRSEAEYQTALKAAELGQITTEILPLPEFFFAEDYHQQYLAKNPGGYCGMGGTGVRCVLTA
ncbi:MAG: peptide-methionine (S)-S-oxide reductase [Gammaproteobacteria bacterium]|jgi:peptide-methionine (S)-S-oxide reductase